MNLLEKMAVLSGGHIPRNGTAWNGPELITIIRNLLYGTEEKFR